MDNEGRVVVYDILRDGIGGEPVAVCLGMLTGLVLGIGLLVSLRRQRKPVGGLVVLLFAWAVASAVGGGNVLYQHLRCAAWARSGEFDVVEGRVTHFHPRVSREKGNESFTVKGITFSYGRSDLGRGGFGHRLGPDGPLHEGGGVRVPAERLRGRRRRNCTPGCRIARCQTEPGTLPSPTGLPGNRYTSIRAEPADPRSAGQTPCEPVERAT